MRRAIGVAPQALALYDLLTGEENLRFFGEVYGLSAPRSTSACVVPRLRRPHRSQRRSRRRLFRRHEAPAQPRGRARARTGLLLLDEPTVGVDPQSRNKIFESIEALHARAAPSSTRRTTWKKPSGCAIASRSSTPASSSRWARSGAARHARRSADADGQDRRPGAARCRRRIRWPSSIASPRQHRSKRSRWSGRRSNRCSCA